MRRTRRRTRRRRRRQRGGFLGALTAGLNKGLAAVGLKKKEEGDDEIKRTQVGPDLSQPSNVDAAPAQEGGRRRRRRSRRRRRTRRRRRSRRGGMCGSCPGVIRNAAEPDAAADVNLLFL